MIRNIGFQFSKQAKAWMAAFVMAATPAVACAASHDEGKHHYELLSLDEIQKYEQDALERNDTQAVNEYRYAEIALQETADGLRASPNDLPKDFEANLFDRDNQGTLYKVINPLTDVDWTEFTLAQKVAEVKAERVGAGTVVETKLADGRVETRKTAGDHGGYRVTNPDGEQYLVDTAKFESIYDSKGEGIYAPVIDPRKVLQVDQNVAFTAPWGSQMFIKKDGVLVNGGHGDVYGIQPDEYKNTYAAYDPSKDAPSV